MKKVNPQIASIDSLPNDDSSNLEYTTQSRFLKGNLYWLDNDIGYQKTNYRRIYAEWSLLKEDSTGSESSARAISQKVQALKAIGDQIDNLEELQETFKVKHLEVLGKEWVKPVKGQHVNPSNQEIDSDFEPKQR